MDPLFLLLPLLAAMAAVAADRNGARARYYALIGSALGLAMLPLAGFGTHSLTWFSVGGTAIQITTSITPLSFMLLFLVLAIGSLVLAYSFGFMDLPSEQRRFYTEMLAFEAAMLAFAMSGGFILLFIAWEFLSLSSYLLIGFWHGREKAVAAARKAITIVLISDIALLAAVVMFLNVYGTLSFSSILAAGISSNLQLAAMALLLIAVITKSAQFPMQEWLTDAMAGPTPVSAYLHSTTMVKAGVFVVLVLLPLFSAAGMMPALLAIAAVTIAVAIAGTLREHQIKRVIAYSTVEELGLILLAASVGAVFAAIYFFFAQSFYKSLLFFGAGNSMKATGSEDLYTITGLGSSRLVKYTVLFGALSLAGFIPFDGFFANFGIASAFAANLAAYALISAASLATSFYIFRWFMLQDRKPASAAVATGFLGLPRSMTYPMAVLAAATIAASGAFFVFPNVFGLQGISLQSYAGAIAAVVETAVVAVGAVAAVLFYTRKARVNKTAAVASAAPTRITIVAEATNAIYAHLAAFVEAVARGFAFFDDWLISAYDVAGHVSVLTGSRLRRIASGSVNTYVLVFAIGLALLAIAVVVV
jgi:NADH-quinone oxidoreductase subunit L